MVPLKIPDHGVVLGECIGFQYFTNEAICKYSCPMTSIAPLLKNTSLR